MRGALEGVRRPGRNAAKRTEETKARLWVVALLFAGGRAGGWGHSWHSEAPSLTQPAGHAVSISSSPAPLTAQPLTHCSPGTALNSAPSCRSPGVSARTGLPSCCPSKLFPPRQLPRSSPCDHSEHSRECLEAAPWFQPSSPLASTLPRPPIPPQTHAAQRPWRQHHCGARFATAWNPRGVLTGSQTAPYACLLAASPSAPPRAGPFPLEEVS